MTTHLVNNPLIEGGFLMYNNYAKPGLLPANHRNKFIMRFRYLINKAKTLEELMVIWKCINTLLGDEMWIVKKLEADKNRRKVEFGEEPTVTPHLTGDEALQLLESE